MDGEEERMRILNSLTTQADNCRNMTTANNTHQPAQILQPSKQQPVETIANPVKTVVENEAPVENANNVLPGATMLPTAAPQPEPPAQRWYPLRNQRPTRQFIEEEG
jgi:hypothetical protein